MPSTLSLLKTLAFASSVIARPNKRDANTVHLDVVKVSNVATGSQVANGPFTHDGTTFFVSLTLGGQQIYSQLDTGSSNLVVFPSSQLPAGGCPFDSADVCSHRTYDPPANSGTSVNTGATYSGRYQDGTGGSGYLYTDTLGFDGNTITQFKFADLTTSNTLDESVFGTGYPTNENVSPNYDNLPFALFNKNFINAPVFSLYVNSLRGATAGSVLYGGIDSQKYCNSLATIPIVPDTNGVYREFNIPLLSIATTNSQGQAVAVASTNSGSSNNLALLDSGTNSISIPQDGYNTLYNNFGASPAASANSFPQVPCSLGSSTQTIDFTFAGIVIPVPISEFVAAPANAGQATCSFYISVQAAGDDQASILGSPFLAAAYVVYDLTSTNNQIHLGRAIANAAGSNVVPVSSGLTPVPSINGPACPASTTTTTSSTSTSVSTTTSSATTATTTNSVSTSSGTSSSTMSTLTTTTSGSTTATSGSSSTTSTGTNSVSATLISTTSSVSTSSGASSTTSTGTNSVSATLISTSSGTSTTSTVTNSVSATLISTSSGASTASTGTNSVSAIPTSTSSTTWGSWSNFVSPTSSTWATWSTSASTWNPSWNTWVPVSDPAPTWVPYNPPASSTWGPYNPPAANTWANYPAITPGPNGAWPAWINVPSNVVYSTITTTIYVCPNWVPNCAYNVMTPTVSTVTVAYTTSTIYSSSCVTLTAPCPATTVCPGPYLTTSWSTYAAATTVYPWTPAATAVAAAQASQWSAIVAPIATLPVQGAPVAATSAAPVSPAQPTWSGIKNYTGAASSLGQSAGLMVAMVAPAVVMMMMIMMMM